MEWWVLLLLICGALMVLMIIGMPVAFAFLAVSTVCAYLFWNDAAGLNQLVLSVMDSVTHFTLMPVPLFILMGEVLFRSGIAAKQLDTLDAWVGRVPGRLSIITIGGGAMFSTLTGSAIASTALLGKILVPEMEKRGYRPPMSLGPILGSGGLAIMIPPSALGVLLAGIANLPVGEFLMGIIVPGLLMAALYATYIVVRCYLQPQLAPAYASEPVPLGPRLRATVIYLFPMAAMVFMVIGLILLGVATPSESAAIGTVGAFALAALYGGLSWKMIRESLLSTLLVSGMVFMILIGSTVFSQMLAFTGISAGLHDLAAGFGGSPLFVVLVVLLIQLVLGMFMEPLSIVVLTVPIYFPIIQALGLPPLWFGAIMLLNMQIATTSPPFGIGLFVMKGVAPAGTPMTAIYRAALPFIACDCLIAGLMLAFPQLVLWLPAQMGG